MSAPHGADLSFACVAGHHAPGAAISRRSALSAVGVDLGERRERLDRVDQHVERHLRADGERRLLEPFAGFGPSAYAPISGPPSLEQGQEPVRWRRPRVYVAVLATADTEAVARKRASSAPTDAACGSVNTTRGSAS